MTSCHKTNRATERNSSTLRSSRRLPPIDIFGNTDKVLNILLTRFIDLDIDLARNGELQSRTLRTGSACLNGLRLILCGPAR